MYTSGVGQAAAMRRETTTRVGTRSLAGVGCAAMLLAGMSAGVARADILYSGTEAPNPYIAKVSPAGSVSTFVNLPAGSFYPEGLAFDSANNLYAVIDNTLDIDRITPAGVVSTFVNLTASDRPRALAVDAADNLYVSDSKQVLRVTPAGAVSQYGSFGADADLLGLAFDRGGALYVTDVDVIHRIAPGGASVTTFATLSSGSAASGLAFDAAGDLYAADFVNAVIDRITPTGSVSTFATLPRPDAQPFGLAFDSAGFLYEGGVDGQIRKISPTGVVSPFASGNDTFTFLAFTDDAGNRLPLPTPEPSSISLLAAASLCAVRRRA